MSYRLSLLLLICQLLSLVEIRQVLCIKRLKLLSDASVDFPVSDDHMMSRPKAHKARICRNSRNRGIISPGSSATVSSLSHQEQESEWFAKVFADIKRAIDAETSKIEIEWPSEAWLKLSEIGAHVYTFAWFHVTRLWFASCYPRISVESPTELIRFVSVWRHVKLIHPNLAWIFFLQQPTRLLVW